MANVQKYTKAACGHMFKHYERAREMNPETGQLEYAKFGNQQINPERSHLNYNLAVHQTMRQGDFIRKRCSEVKLQNRKDVNVMCSWVLTAPKDLPETEQADFFKASYEFMAKRYGKENVISAYVHLDETSPHIHFAFIPVTADKKKGGYKVSAKEAINKHDLQAFHQELSRHLEKALGHSVGVLNGETKGGNKTIAELKEKSARERAEKAEEQAKAAEVRLVETNAQYEAAIKGLEKVLNEKARAAEIRTPNLFSKTVKYDAEMLEQTRSIGTTAAANFMNAKKKEQANVVREQKLDARERQLNEMAAEIVPLHEEAEAMSIVAQKERDEARELRQKQESYIRGTAQKMAQKIADKRIEEMFGDIPDKRGKRLEEFCQNLKFSDGTNALQAFEEQEQALQRRNRGRGR